MNILIFRRDHDFSKVAAMPSSHATSIVLFTTTHKEYFAEVTESYFYRNDFFPFVLAELKRHDASVHDLLVEIWGPVE